MMWYYHALNTTFDHRVEPPRRCLQYHAQQSIPAGMQHVWCASPLRFQVEDVELLRLYSTSNRLKQHMLNRLTATHSMSRKALRFE